MGENPRQTALDEINAEIDVAEGENEVEVEGEDSGEGKENGNTSDQSLSAVRPSILLFYDDTDHSAHAVHG